MNMLKHDKYHHRIYYKLGKETIAELEYVVRKNSVYIVYLHTKRNHRGNGCGTAMINELKSYAKSVCKPISLFALSLDNSISTESLIDYYKQQGFEQDTEHGNNYLIYNETD